MTKECQGDIQVPPSLQKGSKMIEENIKGDIKFFLVSKRDTLFRFTS